MILESLDAPQVLREDVKNLRVVSCCAFAAQDHRSLHCSAAVGHALLGKEWCCNHWGVAALTRNGCELLPNSPKEGAAPKSRDFRGRGHTWPDP